MIRLMGWVIAIRIILIACTVAVTATAKAKEPLEAAAKNDASGNAATEATLTIIDLAGHSSTASASELAGMPRHKVHVMIHDREADFEGVSLADLLAAHGVAFGDNLKGRQAATVALLEASDGYRVPLALLEIDPASTDRLFIVADRRDGKPLTGEEAPFRLIIPDEKRPVRWIRVLSTIRVMNLSDGAVAEPANEGAAPQK